MKNHARLIMEEVNHGRLSYDWHHDGFCRTLAAQGALIHCRQVWEENRLTLRFENGYGVTILPVSPAEQVFEVLVLRFYGTGINDYQVAQYAPIPELNRGNFDEIIDLCKQVARLPISKARTGSSGQPQAKVCHHKLARPCSNFL
jgi:hypothetical protein